METGRTKKHLPSVSSYQGRYFYLAILIGFSLLMITLIGNRYVDEVSRQQVSHFTNRSIATNHLSKVQSSMRDIEEEFYWKLLEPGGPQGNQLTDGIRELQERLKEFREVSVKSQDPIFLDSIAWLQSLTTTLATNTASFLHISSDIERRFPSTLIMQKKLSPHYEAVLHQLTLMSKELLFQNGQTNSTALELINEMRYSWLNMISEARLLVANRFSVFSDTPEAGISARQSNIQLYWDQFHTNLQQIQTLEESEQFDLASPNTWESMATHADEWYKNYQLLLDNLTRPDWRQDIFYFNNRVKPVIKEIKEQVSLLENGLNKQADEYITNLNFATERLSQTINFLAFLGLTLIITAYFYLKRKIIQPIAETTKALKMEASGVKHSGIPTPKLKETRDLVEAFHEMRDQVYKRQEGLDHLAHHDPLTGLPNRVLLKDRLSHAIDMACRNNYYIALMFLDLDNFKQVNDSLGHALGDTLLVKIAGRLQDCLRSTDTIARLGGDEFAILIEDIKSKAHVAYMAEEVINSLEEPFKVEQHELHISASIGIAIAPTDAKQPDILIRDADTAMYEAKRRGRAGFHFFSDELTRHAMHRMELERQLRHGAAHQEFLFHYQPVVSLFDGALHCVEALIRWQPEGEALRYPDSFLSELLDIGIGQLINPDLLKQVAETQKQALQLTGQPLCVSINISANNLRRKDRHQQVINYFKQSDIDLNNLIIEITEDTLTSDLAFSVELLEDLKQLGIRIALDDFGTGQSSLNHLRTYLFDIIKIDREFVRDITTDPSDAKLVKTVIDLSHSFNAQVVAEGVETQEQYDFLIEAGCDHIQGFYISKPIPPESLDQFLLNYEQQKPVSDH